jgi:DNA-binding transcriptional LysR family regulator
MSHPKSGTKARAPGALDDLAVFVAVAQGASFVAASRRLSMPTSSVSRAVARLEEGLGVQLLRRTSRKVVVTDEGRQLVVVAASHVDVLEEALATAADRRPEPAGVVRVTAPAYTGTTLVSRSLAAFAAAHPKVTIELETSNAMRDLVRDGYDFGIRVGEGVVGELVARRAWRGHLELVASQDFVRSALGGRPVVTRDAIEAGPCVVLRTPTVWRFRDAKGRPVEVTPGARFAVNDPRAAVEVARGGLGITLAPADAVAADRRGLATLRAEFGEPEPVDLFLVYPTRRLLPRRVRMAIDWLLATADGAGR